jgi:hypothetical protein
VVKTICANPAQFSSRPGCGGGDGADGGLDEAGRLLTIESGFATEKHMKRSVLIVGTAIGLAAVVIGVKYGPDQLRVWEAQAATAKLLRDPGSATFTDVVVREAAVCGMVNSKNGYGAMAGPIAFIYRKARGAELDRVELNSSDEYRASMKSLCDSEIELSVQSGDAEELGKTPSCLAYKKALYDQREYLAWRIEAEKACSPPK